MTSARELIGSGRFIDPAVIQEAARAGTHRYPYAEWTPLPETAIQPRIGTTTFVLHSMAAPRLTSLDALTRYYRRDDVTGEPTFALDMDGRACEYMETNQRADNNARANRFAASIETQDEGAATLPATPWTAPQMAQLAGMTAFLHLAEGVPLERPAAWDAGGVDGHRAFPEWSIYVGKTCPGDARWWQIPEVIELAGEIVAWRPPTPDPPKEDDMTRIRLARLTDDPATGTNEGFHLRRGDGNVATIIRSREYSDLQALMDRGEAPPYYHPKTGEVIASWGKIPAMTETELDQWVGYVVVPAVAGQHGAPADEG